MNWEILSIRYEITNDVYTKWFPIGVPYYAINLQTQTIVEHMYADGSTTSNCNIEEDFNDDDVDVPYNFELNLSFNNSIVKSLNNTAKSEIGGFKYELHLSRFCHFPEFFRTVGNQDFAPT